MEKNIAVITAREVVQTGEVNFRFMWDSGAPRELYAGIPVFGILTLSEKKDDGPFPYWTVGKPSLEKPVKMKMWEIFLFASGRGQVLTLSAEADAGGEGIKVIVREIQEDCVILMKANDFDSLKRACGDLNVNLKAFHYQGTLNTS